MKIKNTLILSSLSFVVLFAAIGILMIYTFSKVNTLVDLGVNAKMIIKDVFELNIVTYEYLIHHEKRMQQQWLLKYDSLGERLKVHKEELLRQEEHYLIHESMNEDYEVLGDLFSQLQANFAKRKRLREENIPQAEINISFALEERLIAQTLMRSQRITTNTFRLSAMIEQTIAEAQQRANLTIVFSIIGFTIFAFYVSFITIRRITMPINELTKGTMIVGKGDLGHKIDIRTKDEMGQLASSFNQMAGNLKKITASRDELNKEITERKLAEKSLKQRTAELEVANKELESFSYSVSHDLRAPLRAISGFSNILIEDYTDKLDPECKRLLNTIQSNTQKMAQLIDDILTLSRMGRKEIKKINININDLVKSIFEELKPTYPNREIKLSLSALPSAQGDPTLLRAVFINILTNAIKFTKTRTSALIEVGGRSLNNENSYYVKDNGVGFEMKYVDKVFGVFQRLHSDTEFEGTGVGLAIVQRIIHRHGGRVWAEGKVGKGATFYFTLPKKKGET